MGLTSYARFGHLDSAGGSNVLEVVTEHINRKRQPLQFLGGAGDFTRETLGNIGIPSMMIFKYYYIYIYL